MISDDTGAGGVGGCGGRLTCIDDGVDDHLYRCLGERSCLHLPTTPTHTPLLPASLLTFARLTTLFMPLCLGGPGPSLFVSVEANIRRRTKKAYGGEDRVPHRAVRRLSQRILTKVATGEGKYCPPAGGNLNGVHAMPLYIVSIH